MNPQRNEKTSFNNEDCTGKLSHHYKHTSSSMGPSLIHLFDTYAVCVCVHQSLMNDNRFHSNHKNHSTLRSRFIVKRKVVIVLISYTKLQSNTTLSINHLLIVATFGLGIVSVGWIFCGVTN